MTDRAMNAPGGQAPRPLRRRIGGGVVALGALGLVMAGCSSDGDDSTQAYCDAADSLETDIQSLGDINVVSDGTDAIKDQFDKVSQDADDLKNSGSDAASSQIDGLESAVSDLSSAIDDLGSDPSADALSTVADDISQTVTAAQAVVDKLSDSCS